MLNYIRAEIYKVLHRKYTYIVLGTFLVLEALFVAGFAFHNAYSLPTPFGGAIVFIVHMGSIGFCTCLLTGDMVFAGQYKNSTLKNEVSFGLSRTRIYLGKLIAQILLSVAYMVIVVGFFLGACAVFLPIDPPLEPGQPLYYTLAADALTIVGYFLVVAFPLWIGAQSAACMCLFLIRSDVGASVAALGLTMAGHTVIEVAGILCSTYSDPLGDALVQISRHMPGFMMGRAKEVIGDPVFLGKAWIVGAFWLAACTAIGLSGFRKKEIK